MMNKQFLELGFKFSTSVVGLGLLVLGIRQEQRQHNQDLDQRFNNLDNKFTRQINALDVKFTALDTKLDNLIVLLAKSGNLQEYKKQ